MPSTLPDGDPAPASGELPASALQQLGSNDFGIYLHVPFCATRCGYCDFNTYTSTELGGGASAASYSTTAIDELRLARRVLGDRNVVVSTVFVGGGTPTLLPSADLVAMLDAIRSEFTLAPDADVTTEANPESVTAESLADLRAGGFNRVSFGMQSASPHVLTVLDRRHTPGRALEVVDLARTAGFEHVNLDLIYGTPGETDDEWRASLDAAIATGVDHVSAYSLIVEPGTRLAARVSRGELPMPSDDAHADRYEIADGALSAAGFEWYEVSNWARSADAQSRHNLLYWTGGDWWGIGPGAHSHVGGVRWWNVKHPRDYAARLLSGESPAAARELLTVEDRETERIMLRLRLHSGLPVPGLSARAESVAAQAVWDGLVDKAAYDEGVLRLTLRGRLLADSLIRDLVE